jgi:YebC/PmpR family DNA-binding regulatory protein
MSGHSKWSTIKRQKAAKDAARGAAFTKLGNAIAIAARGGADPAVNFALRLAIDKAKKAGLPMSNIQRSVDRGSSRLGGEQIQEITYEGYGPAGVAIMADCITGNVNRTYPEVRRVFSKHGGSIAERGAVAFRFERRGMLRLLATGDDALMAALEAGATDVVQEEGSESVVYTTPRELAGVCRRLEEAGFQVEDATLTWVPRDTVAVTDEIAAGKIMRLMDALDDLDDVTAVHTNFDIPANLLSALE